MVFIFTCNKCDQGIFCCVFANLANVSHMFVDNFINYIWRKRGQVNDVLKNLPWHKSSPQDVKTVCVTIKGCVKV